MRPNTRQRGITCCWQPEYWQQTSPDRGPAPARWSRTATVWSRYSPRRLRRRSCSNGRREWSMWSPQEISIAISSERSRSPRKCCAGAVRSGLRRVERYSSCRRMEGRASAASSAGSWAPFHSEGPHSETVTVSTAEQGIASLGGEHVAETIAAALPSPSTLVWAPAPWPAV